MKANRMVKRAQAKAILKQAKQRMKSFGKVVSETDKRCADCGLVMDESDKSLLDDWMVQVNDEKASLFCPSCFAAKEKANEPQA